MSAPCMHAIALSRAESSASRESADGGAGGIDGGGVARRPGSLLRDELVFFRTGCVVGSVSAVKRSEFESEEWLSVGSGAEADSGRGSLSAVCE